MLFQRLSKHAFHLLASLFLFNSTAHSADIRFAPLPMENSKVVIEQMKPMLDYLSLQTQAAFKIVYLKNYDAIIQAFQHGDIDVAFFGPLPYVTLTQHYSHAQPLVRFLNKQGKDTYTCSLLHIMDEPVGTFKDQRLGLTQPLSTCGYLSMSHLLKKLGGDIEQTRYRYAGSHSEVALGLARGEYDIGGVKTSIGQKFAHLGLEAIAETKALPGFVLVGNQKTLKPDVLQRITKALLILKPLKNKEHGVMTWNWGKNVRYGSVPASDADFQGIRQQLKGLTLPMKGNTE